MLRRGCGAASGRSGTARRCSVGQVRDAHRRVGLVDVLAAGARGAVGVDAQVGGIDLDLDRLVDFRVDEHARERGVPAGVGVERALPHQAMHAGLGAQVAVGVVAGHLERRALDAGDFARRFLEHLDADSPCGRSTAGTCASSIDAQSCASVPPEPAWMSMKQLFGIERIARTCGGIRGPRRSLPSLSTSGVDAAQRRVVVLGARELEKLAARREARCRRAPSVPTTPSSCFFSLPSSCARCGLSQSFGSSSSRSTAARRVCLRIEVKDTSAAAPVRSLRVGEGVGDRVDVFGFHGVALRRLRSPRIIAAASRVSIASPPRGAATTRVPRSIATMRHRRVLR